MTRRRAAASARPPSRAARATAPRAPAPPGLLHPHGTAPAAPRGTPSAPPSSPHTAPPLCQQPRPPRRARRKRVIRRKHQRQHTTARQRKCRGTATKKEATGKNHRTHGKTPFHLKTPPKTFLALCAKIGSFPQKRYRYLSISVATSSYTMVSNSDLSNESSADNRFAWWSNTFSK